MQRQVWSLTPRADAVYVATGATDLVATFAVLVGRSF